MLRNQYGFPIQYDREVRPKKQGETMEPTTPKVEQAHARILREALARVCNLGSPQIAATAMRGLTEYAKAVKPYCQHPQRAQVRDVKRCLDCGHEVPAKHLQSIE